MARPELRIDRRLMELPMASTANPTVWLFAIDLVAYAAVCLSLWHGLIPRELAALLALLCLYCFYTVSHEAVHGNAHPDRRINLWLGRIAAAIEGLSFPLFRIIHLQHHAFTNDSERDPDFVIGRQPRWLLPLWAVVRLAHDNHFMLRRKLWQGKRRQLIEHLVTVALQAAVVAGCVVAGHVEFVLFVWLGPVVISGVLLELTGAWAVHYPHTSTHPLESTRMFRGRLLQVLMLNQNYHLVHHLWPRIPWFRYGQAAAAAEQAVQAHRQAGDDKARSM